jgi:hypothetical protein
MLDNDGVRLRVIEGEPCSPLEVGNEGRPKLGVLGHTGIIGRQAHQRCEPESLFLGDAELHVLVHHPLIAPKIARVARWTAEYLAPPCGHVPTVLFMDATGKERREQLVLLDSVIEGIDHPIEAFLTARPFKECRVLTH